MSELLTYQNILDDIKNFKRSGTAHGNDFNYYDTPSHKYFKILFYFGSASETYNDSTINNNNKKESEPSYSGLLAPTWEEFKIKNQDGDISYNTNKTDFYNYNSAWAYLKMNNEEERAEKLEQFITLLSDINTYSPWYFSQIGGIAEALERKVTEDGKLEMNENKKITITCLPDAFDDRLTTLLDLYRDVTWSWIHKKEIIPANLRKFDMAIYIFETPENRFHKNSDIIGTNNENIFKVSYKMIEFHDCEINYNSIKSGWSELNNETGFSPKYTIEINYSDCYEVSYNNMMMRQIGDVIITDLLNSVENDNMYSSIAQSDNIKQLTEFKNRAETAADDVIQLITNNDNKKILYFGSLADSIIGKNLSSKEIDEYKNKVDGPITVQHKYEYKPGFITTALGQVAGHFVKDVKSLFTKAVLGNLHTYSLTQIGSQLSEAAKGNLIKTGMTVAQYINNSKNNSYKPGKPSGNIFNKDTVANNL